MNDAPSNWSLHFVITYTDDEIRISQNIAAARHASGHQGRTFYALVFASPLAIGLVVLSAFELGLIAPITLQPVLITAFTAFIAGVVSYHLFMRQYFRRMSRVRDGMAGANVELLI